jgi:hypothetical protein
MQIFGGYLMTKMVHFDPDAEILIKSDLSKSCSPDSQKNFRILFGMLAQEFFELKLEKW